MIRLNPTRLELRIDDLNEFSEIKSEYEINKRTKDDKYVKNMPVSAVNNIKTKQEVIQERIGYVPRPRHSSQ